MPLCRRVLDCRPDPLELARRLWDRPGVVLLGRGFGQGRAFVACDPQAEVLGLDPEPTLPLRPDAGSPTDVPRWVGILPYECRRQVERARTAVRQHRRDAPDAAEPRWLRYGAVAVVSDRVEVVGDDEASVHALYVLLRRPPRAGAASLVLAEPVEAAEVHERRIRAALELIHAGELYQVNLARRFRLAAEGSAVELVATMSARGWAPFCAAFDFGDLLVASGSPELLLHLAADRTLRTSPIKGTRPRGTDSDSDARLAAELDQDPKERAELVMIVDVERNDFGRVAEVGSVVLLTAPHVVTLPTVHHRLATIGARLRRGISRTELIEAIVPSGSVTGAPKVRAMEAIAALESHRRGLYTGGFGALCHDGSLALGMAIRTLTVRAGLGDYWAGGGIVADSDPRREVEETQWKASQIAALAGG